MANILYAIGTESTKYYTTSHLLSSTDGLSWSVNTSDLFPVHCNPECLIATNTTILVFNSRGQAAVSNTAGQTWAVNQIDPGFLPLSALSVDTTYYVVGLYKYQTATGDFAQWDEVARIYASTDGLTWNLEFSHSETNSCFYQIKNNGNDLYVAGQANNRSSVWTNANSSWEKIDLGTVGPTLGLTINSNLEKIYFSGVGYIIKYNIANSSHQINWIDRPTVPIVHIARKTNIDDINWDLDPGLVATSHQAIYSTLDGINWTKFHVPGYYFNQVIWFNNSWIVSSYSNQTLSTYWQSTDGITWYANNNGIQMQDFAAFVVTPIVGAAQLDYSDPDSIIWNWWERNV